MKSQSTFADFFTTATGEAPYPYQAHFAEAEKLPHLLRAPTGSGKTATALLGWLWRREVRPADTPTRLVYCLPMRVLVEQTVRAAEKFVQNLNLQVPIHVLMGGAESEQWYLYPERPTVLIGTQDMLLSRALNRGYAASRFHWPIDFGLLNNDCLWVFDEPQLMANGVSTSAQLAGLREPLGVFGGCPSLWMSATLEPGWLDTIDYRNRASGATMELSAADFGDQRLKVRMTAAKRLSQARTDLRADHKEIARLVLDAHEKSSQTLVIMNTVERAKGVYHELARLRGRNSVPDLLLIHSRFRAEDRRRLNDKLQSQVTGDRIIVSTQVVEAGVDISSRVLVTELAPWPSLVQRFGRCNRKGTDGGDDHPAQIKWIDLDDNRTLPYEPEELSFARQHLQRLENKNIAPRDLEVYSREERIVLPFKHTHVLRRRDLIDLFDTSPDLSGNDIDVQRFVRSADPDVDLQVFWRDLSREGWDVRPERDELCPVPVGGLRQFLKKARAEARLWDHLDQEWRMIRDSDRELRPGLLVLLPHDSGGYSNLGWDPASSDDVPAVFAVEGTAEVQEALGDDPLVPIGKPFTIAEHTSHVVHELLEILRSLPLPLGEWSEKLLLSVRWHDVGKAHQVFAEPMKQHNGDPPPAQHWAKSGKKGRLRYARKHFRHELASALAFDAHIADSFDTAYLIACHHGRVRLSIRTFPDESAPEDHGRRFALGIHDGDELPAISVDGQIVGPFTLDLSPMELGGPRSWTRRALKLLSQVGPFRLAYLESVIRAADSRASKKEAQNA
jgi:CRISPR-associated endonuclease/helicase Cas3